MLKKSKLLVCIVAIAMCFTGFAVPVGAAGSEAPQDKTSCTDHEHCHKHFGHAKSILADITGKSVQELDKQYPQKTAWQIAKSMGKLDQLKTAYIAKHKAFIDKLVADKKITADDGTKMYTDLQKRVDAIDGVNIVIPGSPQFVPEKR